MLCCAWGLSRLSAVLSQLNFSLLSFTLLELWIDLVLVVSTFQRQCQTTPLLSPWILMVLYTKYLFGVRKASTPMHLATRSSFHPPQVPGSFIFSPVPSPSPLCGFCSLAHGRPRAQTTLFRFPPPLAVAVLGFRSLLLSQMAVRSNDPDVSRMVADCVQ